MSNLERDRIRRQEILWTKCILLTILITVCLIWIWGSWSYDLFYAQQIEPGPRPRARYYRVFFWRSRLFQVSMMLLFFLPLRTKGQSIWSYQSIGMSLKRVFLLLPAAVSAALLFNGNIRGLVEPLALHGYRVSIVLGTFIIALIMRGVVALLFRLKMFPYLDLPIRLSGIYAVLSALVLVGSVAVSSFLKDLAETIPNFIYP